MFFYRVTVNNEGIYNALKSKLWIVDNNPKQKWMELKNSSYFNWLKVPNVEYNNCKSYFTQKGYENFTIYTLPLLKKYFNNDEILIEECYVDLQKVIYEDDDQIVIINE